MPTLSDRRGDGLWGLATVAVALLLGAAAGLREVAGLDIFWHLRVGERLWHTPGWLPVDTLSSGSLGNPWPYKDILADVVLFLLVDSWGIAAMSVVPALAAAAVALAILCAGPAHQLRSLPLALPRSLPQLAWRAGLAACALAAMFHRLHARPLLWSLVGFAWLWVLLRRSAGPAGGGLRAWLPNQVAVIALLWCWGLGHRGVILGLALAGSAWLRDGALLAKATGAPRQSPGKALAAWLGVGALIAAAPVANPNGLATLTTAWGLVGGDAFRAWVSEWQPLPWSTLLRHHGSVVVPFVVLASVAAARRWRRRGDADEPPPAWPWPETLVAIALLAAIADASRWLPYAALAGALTAAPLAETVAAAARARGALALAAVGCLAIVALHPGGVGVGLASDRYPSAVLDQVSDLGLDREPLNAYDFGGYLLWAAWPSLRPALDGRADMVYTPEDFALLAGAERDSAAWERWQRRRRDRGQRAHSWVIARQQGAARTHAYLASDKAWRLVAWSEPAVVWARADAAPAIEARAFRVFAGVELDREAFAAGLRCRREPAICAVAEAEWARMAAASPGSLRVAVAGVVLAHAAGDVTRRNARLDALVAAHGTHPAVLTVLERVAGRGAPGE